MAIIQPAVVRGLEARGVEWVLLRAGRGAGTRDDVDVLVRAADLADALDVLRGLNYLEIPSWGRGSHRFFVHYDVDNDMWTKLDIVTELAFGRHYAIRVPVADAVIRRRHRDDGVWVLHQDDAFWLLTLHCLLDRHHFANEHRVRLRAATSSHRRTSAVAEWFDAHASSGGRARKVEALVEAGEWAELARLGRRLESRLVRALGLDGTVRLASRAVLSRGTKLVNLLHRRGISVALMGPDGAGKSSLATALAHTFYFPVRTVYMGIYSRSDGAARRFGVGGRLVYLWGRYLVGMYHRARGRLVVYDRFAYDALISARSGSSLRARARRWILAHACPAPDVVVVLDAPGDVLFRRSREHDIARLEAQRASYQELGGQLENATVLDATADADWLRRQVTSLIWDRYVARSAAATTSRPRHRGTR